MYRISSMLSLVQSFRSNMSEKIDQIVSETEVTDEEMTDNEYDVEQVCDRRRRKGELQYLIKWKNWDHEHNTWEKVDNLKSCQVKIPPELRAI